MTMPPIEKTPTHETVAVPEGVAAPRFRPPAGASSARALSLNGPWRFQLFPQADTGVAPAERGEGWDTIVVPGHWQLAGAPSSWPYGTPAYNNKLFPFPVDPPRVPQDNPTGEYRIDIALPEDWPQDGRTVLRFEGVDSWFRVGLNGRTLAHSHGSRLPTEIDITGSLRPGTNLLAVTVTKWSAYSYVEDQDQWWLSGIFRDVSIEHRPAEGIDHARVTAEYDERTGRGTLRVDVDTDPGGVRVRVPELGLDIAAGETVSVPVEPWSAEIPRLYDVLIEARGESVALPVGFRTVAVRDGRFLVNGRAVTFRGVNRHEFDPLRGRAVTPERMLEDVLLMKRHNINAVRTSHYPPHPHFLDLCDRYGLYVVDENDLETHGFENIGWLGNPVDDPEWEDVLVDRVTRMVRRDAHHPSIVMWSLGNEAGRGRNIRIMADAVRALDPSRPVHYEGDYSSDEVDVYSRMYATSEETELIGRGAEAPLSRADLDARRRAMPFIQCEYAHAMGNGPGGLSEYDAIFDAHPRLAGGFIWEWIDHGLLREDEEGRRFHAYGGDFGEAFHDGTFVADGLLLPDRTPSPGLLEVKAVFAPIRIDPASHGGSLRVRNRQVFRDTGGMVFRWTLHEGGEVLGEGEYELALLPGESVTITPPGDLPVPDAPQAPVWFTVRAVQIEPGSDELWWEEPFTITEGQLLLKEPAPLAPARGAARGGEAGGYAAGPAEFSDSGELLSLFGRAVRQWRPDAWRAPIDNDRRSGMWVGPSDMDVWRSAGLHLLAARRDRAVLTADGALRIEGRTAGPATGAGLVAHEEWRPVGADRDAVDLVVDIRPEGRWPQSVARLGMVLALQMEDAGAVRVDWDGLGPGESYADSHRAALGGRYSHTVDEWQTRYTHPQENGARRGVTRADLLFPDGEGIRIEVDEVVLGGRRRIGAELSLRPWPDQQLDAAAHPTDLRPDGNLWIHIDAAQHGVGSAACGPGVLAGAQLRAAPVRLRVRLSRRR